jgi:hypothetical protein
MSSAAEKPKRFETRFWSVFGGNRKRLMMMPAAQPLALLM